MDTTQKPQTEPDSDVTDEHKNPKPTARKVAPGTPDPRIKKPQDNRVQRPK